MGTEDVKVTAINMYKYKERLRLYKRWPCSTVSFLQTNTIYLKKKRVNFTQERVLLSLN